MPVFSTGHSSLIQSVYFQRHVWRPLPAMIYGTLGIGVGLICLMLPETKGTILPETIEDATNLGRCVCPAHDLSKYPLFNHVNI